MLLASGCTRPVHLFAPDCNLLSPAGQQDQARRRFHARIDRAGHEKAENRRRMTKTTIDIVD